MTTGASHDLGALRVVLITDGPGDPARLIALVEAAVAGGVRAVQLREPRLAARALAALCERLRPRLEACRGLLLVNDRADLAAAGLAHGVHLGRHSLAPGAVRRFVPDGTLIGCSAHDASELAHAAVEGADYASLSPVLPTRSHPGTEPLGLERTRALLAQARLPVVLLGGIDASNLEEVAALRPAGIAVLGAICRAPDPRAAAAALVKY